MANKNRRSVATIDSPEFINITQMSNPLISKCEIKVLYIGENRNQSFITKEVATEMAQTLPGCPIVGYYIENKEDFGDHGDQVIIDGEGVKFKKLTKPYGFVAPDSKVWFQKFEDTDEFGNTTLREYLMTEGYLWTGQYEEAKRVLEKGNPQSMELDEETLKGYWSTDVNRGLDFFIINDAIFSKLCILGEDVEPCFEGASVTAPSEYSKDENFAKSLATMMAELKFALKNDKGGLSMDNMENTTVVEETTVVENPVENFSNEEGKTVETVVAENDNNTEEFAKKEEEDDKKEEEKSEPTSDDDKPAEDKEDEEDEDKKKKDVAENACKDDDKKKYELLEQEYADLQQKYSLLEEENKQLKEFKAGVEDEKKDELINSFYMLSAEDKKDVIENKANYSLDDIKAKLSIICVDKKVDFSLGNEEEKAEPKSETAPITYDLNSHEVESLPAWLKAVEDVQNSNK